MSNGGYDRPTGDSILVSSDADLVSFGKLFIANPDLPKPLELNADLNTLYPKTFYALDAIGYTDYALLELQTT